MSSAPFKPRRVLGDLPPNASAPRKPTHRPDDTTALSVDPAAPGTVPSRPEDGKRVHAQPWTPHRLHGVKRSLEENEEGPLGFASRKRRSLVKQCSNTSSEPELVIPTSAGTTTTRAPEAATAAAPDANLEIRASQMSAMSFSSLVDYNRGERDAADEQDGARAALLPEGKEMGPGSSISVRLSHGIPMGGIKLRGTDASRRWSKGFAFA